MKTMTTAQYLHGTREEEQRRLSALNTIVNDASLREIRLRGDERVLEIGSGLGSWRGRWRGVCTPPGGGSRRRRGVNHLVDMVAGATRRLGACGLMDQSAAAAGVHEVRA